MNNEKEFRKSKEEETKQKIYVQNLVHQNERLKERIEELKSDLQQKEQQLEYLE